MFELEEPISQSPDLTLLFIVFVVIVLIVFSFLFKWFRKLKFLKKGKIIDIKNLDLNDTKNTAYLLSEFADLYARDNPYYEALKEHLKDYKYKKEVLPFDKETLTIIQNFKEAL